LITKWKSDHAYNTDDAKTPTELVYEEPKVVYREDSDSERSRTISGWGHDIKSDERPLKWFKLCLVDPKNLPANVRSSAQVQQAQQRLDDLGISAIEATSDYLRQLWNHTIASIERELGKRAVDGLPFRVIVTVPAIWPANAMQRTEEAAKRAGILKFRICGETKLDLVPEPEAAALATLAEFSGRPGVREDDVITVCDCGGGTIVTTPFLYSAYKNISQVLNKTKDVTSYQVEKVDPIVLVKECVGGDGEKTHKMITHVLHC
jgi:molecular chaperone DnaK (HSP70)